MSAVLLQIAGWSVLPDFVTRYSLSFIHQTVFRFLQRSPPPQGSPVYAHHYRYTYAAVVLGYLLYNFLEASTALPKNFYELLDVRPAITDDSTLKTAFRTFARKHHPDRIGPQGEGYFIQVRDAFEALKDPVVRFAYDRFGPDVLQWKDCSTMKEYLRRGLLSSSAYYIVTGAALVLYSVIGKPSPIATWRYLLFIMMLALELYLLLVPPSHPAEPSPFVDHIPPNGTLLDYLFPHRVVYQHIRLLHQAFLFVSVALSRVAPVLFPSLGNSNPAVEQQMLKAVADRLGMLAQSTERERGLDGTSPDVSKLDEDVMRTLCVAMEDILIETKLKSEDGPMRSAWDRAVQKKMHQVPSEIESRVSGDVLFSHRNPVGGKLATEGPSIKRALRTRSISL
ncbi:hypothetical protein V8B97DRAFT_1871187 [Scleroderma yunnanense]